MDGRSAVDSPQGPQMLGGSLHSILLFAIFQNEDFSENSVLSSIEKLQAAGFRIGAHRGSHAHDDASDCGFADRMADIMRTTVKNKTMIVKRLTQIFQENREYLESPNLPPFEKMLDNAFKKIENFDSDRIKLSGENLVQELEAHEGAVEMVQGDHAESVAFVNTKRGITLDTIALNQDGLQAFNLDMPQINLQTETLGIPLDFTIPASLILYMATEMVLVEQKGKPAIPMVIYA